MTFEAHSRRHVRSAAPEMPGDTAPADAQSADASSTIIDCDRCTMRGIGCGDCVVTVLLGGPPFGVELDDAEAAAIEVLARAGLVPPLRMVEPLDSRRLPGG